MKSKESRPYLGFLKEYAFKKKLLPSYILTIATIVLTAGVSLVRPELQGKVIDDLGNPHSTSLSAFMLLLVVFLGMLLLNYLMNYVQRYIVAVISEEIAADMRQKVEDKLSTVSVNFFEKIKLSDILLKVDKDVSAVKQCGITSIITLVSNIVILVVVPPYMFSIHKGIAVSNIILLVSVPFISRILGKLIQETSGQVLEGYNSITNVLTNTYDNWFITRLFQCGQYVHDMYFYFIGGEPLTFEYKGYGGRGMCDMITTQNKKEIEDSLVAGRMPENSHEILVKTGYEDFGEEVKVGMQFEISFGKEKIPVTVSGIFQSTKFASALGSGRGGFNAAMMCMTEDAFKELLPGIKNFDFTWGINIDPKEQSSVDENLRNTISKNEDIAIESFSERVKGYEKDNTIYFVLQVISILIFLFGVINLINTTLSNQLFRRREYSVLRSIGLTEKQLYKVIIGEGMCYSILSICMTLLIGTPIAMLICRQMSISCYGKVVEYSFPFFYMGIYVLVLLLIQVILSIYQIREQKKKSIIDQLRME